MENDLNTQADVLAERAKQMARRARAMKEQARQAIEDAKAKEEHEKWETANVALRTVAASFLEYLRKDIDQYEERDRLLREIGLSKYDRNKIAKCFPQWAETVRFPTSEEGTSVTVNSDGSV